MKEIIVGLLALSGVILAQLQTHRHWTKEQERKAEERDARELAKREQLLEEAGKERRREQTQMVERITAQTDRVLEGALQIADVHRLDAEASRLLATQVSNQHHECQQEVAKMGAKVEELRLRITENERTSGLAQLMAERHQDIKHRALNCLSVSEGTLALVQKRVASCSCGAFDPIEEVVSDVHPAYQDLIRENALPLEEWVRLHQQFTEGGTIP